jgi:glucuronokinase
MVRLARGQGTALARAALAGNPSDGYGGAVLAVTLDLWRAEAEAAPAQRRRVSPASSLVEAAVGRFARELDARASRSAIRWRTSIPMNVGLAGSSALVIAVIRALCDLYAHRLDPADLAALALAVETEDLGVVAGLQDRVAQAYEGLVFMDFGAGNTYEPLDPELLPPLMVAWRPDAGGHSGEIHASLKQRHRSGEPLVHETMCSLADVARDARAALVGGNLDRFAQCLDRTYELRKRVIALDPRCVEMVELARRHGASANYTGSGGAIVAASVGLGELESAERGLRAAGCEVATCTGTGARVGG